MESKITHPELVTALAKPGADIVASLTAEDAHALHMAVGISGEAGELLDAVKKAAIYRKPIDRENVIEEMGDLEFYMEGLRQGLGITREEGCDLPQAYRPRERDRRDGRPRVLHGRPASGPGHHP